jgi:50S ribosomal protein L16 3-hydroxylase
MTRVVEALNVLRMNDPDRLGDWFGRFITLYRNAGEVAPGDDLRSRIEIEWDLQHDATLLRHPFSRMAWRKAGRGARLYVNGQEHALPVRDARRVANADTLDGDAYTALSEAGRDRVFGLLQAGHYRLALDGEEEE